MVGDDESPLPLPPPPVPDPVMGYYQARHAEWRPFLAGVAARLVETSIGMLIVMCGVGFIGRRLVWSLEQIVAWMLVCAAALGLAGFALALASAAWRALSRRGRAG